MIIFIASEVFSISLFLINLYDFLSHTPLLHSLEELVLDREHHRSLEGR